MQIMPVAQRREEEASAPQENGNNEYRDGDEDGRITFDDTSEFVLNVTLESIMRPVKAEREDRATSAPQEPAPVVVKIERGENGEIMDEDEDMSDDEDEALAEMAAREGLSLPEYREKIDKQMREMSEIKAEDIEVSYAPLLTKLVAESRFSVDNPQEPSASEPAVGNGMAGVLNLLRQQGTLKKRTAEDEQREKVQKQHDLWLADWRSRQAKMELERIQARGGNKDQAQREWENRQREQNEAREALEAYRNYKPDVNIVYHDEFGRGKCVFAFVFLVLVKGGQR